MSPTRIFNQGLCVNDKDQQKFKQKAASVMLVGEQRELTTIMICEVVDTSQLEDYVKHCKHK